MGPARGQLVSYRLGLLPATRVSRRVAAQRAVDVRVDSAPPRIPLHIAGVPPVPAGASASAAHHLEVAGIAVRTPAMVVRPKTGVTAVAHLTDGVAAVTRVGVVAPRPSVTAMG